MRTACAQYLLGICITLFAAIPVMAESSSGHADLTGLSVEQLLNVEVYSASKFTQKITEAPSAVSVIQFLVR